MLVHISDDNCSDVVHLNTVTFEVVNKFTVNIVSGPFMKVTSRHLLVVLVVTKSVNQHPGDRAW